MKFEYVGGKGIKLDDKELRQVISFDIHATSVGTTLNIEMNEYPKAVSIRTDVDDIKVNRHLQLYEYTLDEIMDGLRGHPGIENIAPIAGHDLAYLVTAMRRGNG